MDSNGQFLCPLELTPRSRRMGRRPNRPIQCTTDQHPSQPRIQRSMDQQPSIRIQRRCKVAMQLPHKPTQQIVP